MPVSQLQCEWACAKKKKKVTGEREKLAIATFAISPHRIILCDDINLV